MTVRILIGDVREKLAELPAESVHMVVTSPPYWGLRDYGTARWESGDADCDHSYFRGGNGEASAKQVTSGGTQKYQYAGTCKKCGARRIDRQLGMEPTLGEHIETMVAVFREVRRVLRPDGSVWLNYGDCYATAPNGRSAADTKAAGGDDRTFRDKPFSTVGPIYDPDGGAKGGGFRGDNLGRTETDKDAIPKGRIVAGGTLKPKDLCMVPNRLAIALQDDGWWVRSEIVWGKPNGMPDSSGRFRPATAHEKIFLLSKTGTMFYDHEAVKMPCNSGPSDIRKMIEKKDRIGGKHKTLADPLSKASAATSIGRKRSVGDPDGRLLRNYEPDLSPIVPPEVWHIPTAGFAEAHFATFPPALVAPCIMAGCPEGGTVLDPFGGSGTTGMVADRLGRDCILIELNPDYAEMARRRIENDAGMFAQVEAAE